MKLNLVLASALLSAAAGLAFAADPAPAPAPAAAAPVSAFDERLRAIMDNVQKKIEAGDNTEASLAPELKQFDALIAAHRANKNDAEDVAKAMYIEADLYMKVLENHEKAASLLEAIKADYPRTRAYFPATEMLDEIDLQKETYRIQSALKPGTTFPDFAVTDTKGAPLSVSRFKGKVVLLDFWATWCPPCIRELPNVKAAYAKYHDKGFEIVGITLDDNAERFKNFVASQQITWPQYYEGNRWNNSIGKKYGVSSIPTTYLIGPDGKIVARNLRGPALEQELAKLLK